MVSSVQVIQDQHFFFPEFLILTVRDALPNDLFFPDFITLVRPGEEHELYSSSLCSILCRPLT